MEVAKKEICKGTQHFEIFFQDIIDAGGEGIILRDPLEAYKSGRSPGYLKHKATLSPLLSPMDVFDLLLVCRNFETAKPK